MGRSDEKKRSREDDSSDEKSRKRERGASHPVISASDFFLRNAEFSLWLSESKGISFGSLSSEKARAYFAKFVRRWNDGRLSDRYYRAEGRVDTAVRSGHKWAFAARLNPAEMDAVRDAVDGSTYKVGPKGAQKAAASGSAVPAAPVRTAASMVPELPPEMRDRRAERRAEKAYKEHKDMVLEELAPRATGREVMLEKRAMRRAAKRDGELSPELHDSVVLGTDELDRERIERERAAARDAALRARRQEETNKKLEEHRARENAKMEELRQLAKLRQWERQ